MISGWNLLEDILKNQKPIDAQIQSAEQELAALNEKRKELQARIEQLKMQKQTIADEQLPFPVILTERKEHLETLKSLLENETQYLVAMRGGMGKKQRLDTINMLESLPDDSEKALLATGRYLAEGFDDERLDTLFLTLPISWKGTLNQYAGRLHRIHESKKEVIIYDCADLNVPVLARMYNRRIEGYRSIGYEIEDD